MWGKRKSGIMPPPEPQVPVVINPPSDDDLPEVPPTKRWLVEGHGFDAREVEGHWIKEQGDWVIVERLTGYVWKQESWRGQAAGFCVRSVTSQVARYSRSSVMAVTLL